MYGVVHVYRLTVYLFVIGIIPYLICVCIHRSSAKTGRDAVGRRTGADDETNWSPDRLNQCCQRWPEQTILYILQIRASKQPVLSLYRTPTKCGVTVANSRYQIVQATCHLL